MPFILQHLPFKAWLLAMSNMLASSSRNKAQASNKLFQAVDFELFRYGTEAEVSKASRLLRTYGAFRIKNHGIPPRVTTNCFQYVCKQDPFAIISETENLFPFDVSRPGNCSTSLPSSRTVSFYTLGLIRRKFEINGSRKKASNLISNQMLL